MNPHDPEIRQRFTAVKEQLDALRSTQEVFQRLRASTASFTELFRLASQQQTVNTRLFSTGVAGLVEMASLRTDVFQRFFEQEQERRRQLELLTKPLAELISERIGRIMIAPPELEWLRTLNNQFAGYRAMVESLKAATTADRQWAASTFAGFASMQVVGGAVIEEATEATESDATTADREVCLAGSMAAVASDSTAPEVETRIVEIVGSIEDLLARHLPQIGAGLVAKWRGAHEAITCKNPDRAAQVSMSLRELIKGTVNALVASDTASFMLWIKTQNGGRDTLEWKARFLLRGTLL